VVVPRADADSYLHPLATRAGERVAAPVATFIELAQQAAYVTVVMAQRDRRRARNQPPPVSAGSAGLTTSAASERASTASAPRTDAA